MTTAPSALLLQARHAGDPARTEEVESFARRSELPLESFVSHDLLEGPPSLGHARSFDCVMMGGSGDFYVSKGDLHGLDESLAFLAEVSDSGPPMFASCFGFQCLVAARGGVIEHDPGSTEVGTYEVSLTAEGKGDPLFGQLPERFWAQLGRKDRATKLPGGVPNLASSDLCGMQALRVPGRPVWASQFHPELDGETNRNRFLQYLAGYSDHMSDEEREEALGRFRGSPQTEGLLGRFVKLVFG